MRRIASFSVDHRYIREGIYLSRVDGDVTTYDLRTRRPNCEDYMDNRTMHSVEHLFATMVRNSELADDVLYFGPMGCQTGFYLLIRNADHARVLRVVREIVGCIAVYDGPMPGCSEMECGNYRSLDLESARRECRRYAEAIRDGSVERLAYPT